MLDDKQLAELYEKYGFFVHRRCARLLGSNADADDAVQDVFMRAMRYGDSLREGEKPLPWLYGIADRHCFDVFAKRKRIAGPRETERALLIERTPSVRGVRPERVQLAAQVLSQCKEKVRDAAVLYYVDEMTQDEVATAMGVSRKTVKERLAQFMQVARNVLTLPQGKERA